MKKSLLLIFLTTIVLTGCSSKLSQQNLLLQQQNLLLQQQLNQESGQLTGVTGANTQVSITSEATPIKEKTKEDYDKNCNSSWEGTICNNIYNCKEGITPGNCVCSNGVVWHKDYHCNVPTECSTEMLFATCSFRISDHQLPGSPYYGVEKTITRPVEQIQYDLCNGTCKKYFNAPGYKYNGW